MLRFNTVPSEAYYYENINTSNTFNPSYPSTPLIDSWTYDNNYSTPYILPSNPVPAAYIAGSKWGGIKLGYRIISEIISEDIILWGIFADLQHLQQLFQE
jgi:hypothetical protein